MLLFKQKEAMLEVSAKKLMTSLINEFFQIAQNYSDLLEDTEWSQKERSSFVAIGHSDMTYSDLLEDSEWK